MKFLRNARQWLHRKTCTYCRKYEPDYTLADLFMGRR